MKTFKKILSVVLSGTLMCTMLGGIPAFAAQGGETVIFSDDFEARAEGSTITKDSAGPSGWSDVAVSQTSVNSVKTLDGSKVAELTNSAEKRGAPRIGKIVFTDGLTNLKISFRVKTNIADSSYGFSNFQITNGDANVVSKAGVYANWTTFVYDLNFKDGTYTVSQNGGAASKPAAFAASVDSQVIVRFASGISHGACVYYDDIKFSTTDKVDNLEDLFVNTVPSLTYQQQADNAAKVCKTAPPMYTIPNGATTLFTYVGNNGSSKLNTGTDASWTGRSSSTNILPVEVSKNECLMMVNLTRGKTTANLTKNISLGEKPENLTIDTSVFLIGNSSAWIQLKSGTTELLPVNFKLSKSTDGATDGWNNLKYDFDFKKSTFSVSVNGKSVVKNQAFSKTASYENIVSVINMSVSGADGKVLLDNCAFYTTGSIVHTSMLYGTQGVQWDLVKGEPLKSDSYISNLRAHPRVLVTSWDEMKSKIETNSRCAEIYAGIMAEAEKLMSAKLVEYTFSNGRNWLGGARDVRNRLVTLGFAYGTTGDRKYIDRALSEMRNAATFPDWSNGYAPIIPAEAMMGYSIALDWMYYGLTDDEKNEIIDYIFKMALWQFVHSYAGNNNAEIARGITNRTTVANSCAVMCAVAIADEYPDVANYILPNAIKYALPAMKVYNDDGGFPEGSMYWEYSTRFAVLLISTLLNATVDGYTPPANVREITEMQSMKNTPKYCVYLNSVNEKFNFGDANSVLNYSPTLYFFAKYSNEPFYQWYSDNLAAKKGHDYSGNDGVQALIWYNADMDATAGDADLNCLFNSETAAVVTMRSSFADDNALFCAMQGGSNATGHMGHSLGTFVIDANGKRFIKTMGASNYSKQFDSSLYYVTRTEGSNTLLANPGTGQGQEKKGTASFIDYKSDNDEAFSVLDMTKSNLAFKSAKRGFYMTKGKSSVILQDEFEMNSPSELYWFAHTSAAITLSSDKKSALLDLGGERMLVVLSNAPSGAVFEIMQTTQLLESTIAPDDSRSQGYKLAIHMTNITSGTISVEFIPLKHGEAPSLSRAQAFKPISSWSLSPDSSEKTAADALGDAITLKMGSPVAYASGTKTYVDESNMNVAPIELNGRTLVPVRFISEKFGATVGWEESTQKVTVTTVKDTITLTLGSDKMYVNGEEHTLDVPAQTINDRTLIPLRALVEALGKEVFWDDRGIISISREPVSYTSEELDKIDAYLGTRVLLNGTDVSAFSTDKTDYVLTAPNGSTVTVLEGDSTLPVTLTDTSASFSYGGKNYTIRFENNMFDGLLGTNTPGTIASLIATKESAGGNDDKNNPWMTVKNVTMSTGEEKYIPTGTIDNVINDQLINRWSGNGIGAYLIYDFGEQKTFHSFGLAGLNGDTRAFKFSVSVSDDNELWTEVIPQTQTSGKTKLFDTFNMNGAKGRYVKVTGYGDSNGGTYNSWTEVRFWESQAQQDEDRAGWEKDGYFTSAATNSVGDVVLLKISAMDAAGKIVDSGAITFESSDEKVATVDQNGKITFIGKGSVSITASVYNGFRTVTCKTDFECK